MSGIFGLLQLDKSPVDAVDLQRMAAPLVRRGPEGTRCWKRGHVGLGHTLLATTPEAVWERQPFVHEPTGTAITADVRLDNREELVARLGLRDRGASIGDAELILESYLRWDTACVESLLGDFAFAVWDPRRERLFGARDHFGMRPFYYHHAPGRHLVFGSEPQAILALEQVPHQINEGRIADFLVDDTAALEGIDFVSTFFEGVYRLPPAHTLTASPQRLSIERYWEAIPGPELHLASDRNYVDAFLEVFTAAVRSRLRSPGPVGAMLSGGVDSGAVVAVARMLQDEAGANQVQTLSATALSPEIAPAETAAISAVIARMGLQGHQIVLEKLADMQPELERRSWSLSEPFDGHMAMQRAVYLTSQSHGLKVVLDGVGGDMVFDASSYLGRLLKSGHLLTAYREATSFSKRWPGTDSPWLQLMRVLRSSLETGYFGRSLRGAVGRYRFSRQAARAVAESLISSSFAARIDLARRLATMAELGSSGARSTYGMECAAVLGHTFLTVGRERYDRTASSAGVEPRDPFLDLRVVSFCLRLPWRQRIECGWPKILLRRAVEAHLPRAACWRSGTQHVGWAFVLAELKQSVANTLPRLEASRHLIAPFVKLECSRAATLAFFGRAEPEAAPLVRVSLHLTAWLAANGRRMVE